MVRMTGKVSCAVRPERITILPASAAVSTTGNRLAGRVSKRIFAGDSSTYFIERAGQTIKVLVQNAGQIPFDEGQDIVLTWSPESTVLIRT